MVPDILKNSKAQKTENVFGSAYGYAPETNQAQSPTVNAILETPQSAPKATGKTTPSVISGFPKGMSPYPQTQRTREVDETVYLTMSGEDLRLDKRSMVSPVVAPAFGLAGLPSVGISMEAQPISMRDLSGISSIQKPQPASMVWEKQSINFSQSIIQVPKQSPLTYSKNKMPNPNLGDSALHFGGQDPLGLGRTRSKRIRRVSPVTKPKDLARRLL